MRMVCAEWALQYIVGVVLLTLQRSTQGVAHLPPTHTSPTACPGCPYFLETPSKVKTAVGDAANLTCGVRMLGDRQVSWIRRRDLHVLTTDAFTYTTDSRFRAIHVSSSPYWILQVGNPTVDDSGIYECQVSAQPKIFRRFTLTVIVPRATINGASAVFMKAGSEINITCFITGVTEQTSPVTWYHVSPHTGIKGHTEEVNAGGRGGVQLVTDRRAGSSWLLVTNATWRDAGNYTCAPAHATPASVSIHVLDEETPAAMQPDLQASGSPPASSPSASSSSSSSSSVTHYYSSLLLCQKGFSARSLLFSIHSLALAFVFIHRLFFKTIYFLRGSSPMESPSPTSLGHYFP